MLFCEAEGVVVDEWDVDDEHEDGLEDEDWSYAPEEDVLWFGCVSCGSVGLYHADEEDDEADAGDCGEDVEGEGVLLGCGVEGVGGLVLEVGFAFTVVFGLLELDVFFSAVSDCVDEGDDDVYGCSWG